MAERSRFAAELNKMLHNYYGILPRSEYPDIYNLVTAAICELQRKGSNFEFSVRGLLNTPVSLP